MTARPLLPLVGAAGLTCVAVLWIALERAPTREAPLQRLELPLPKLPASPAPLRAVGLEAVRREAAEESTLDVPSGSDLPPPAPQRAEARREPAIVGDVPRPDPGSRNAPVATEHYENGQRLYEAHMRQLADGSWVLDGPWNSWHPNGEMQEQGAYRNEREHGPWEWRAENGQTIATGSFIDGVREGPWSFWHENGARLMDATYANGVGAGRWTMYHENGSRAAEGEYVDGEISGYWTVWDEFGSIDTERSGTYANGERVGD